MFLNTGACKKICRTMDVRRMWEKSVHNGKATFEHLMFCEHIHTPIHCHRIYGKHVLNMLGLFVHIRIVIFQRLKLKNKCRRPQGIY